jgi:hypothetical protein
LPSSLQLFAACPYRFALCTEAAAVNVKTHLE